MRGLIKGTVVLGIVAVTLSGCGGGDSAVKNDYYRLKEVNRFTPKAGSADLDKTSRQLFTYKDSSIPDKTILYAGSGTDATWGTADDLVGFYVTCAFSGKAVTVPLDLELEIRAGLADLYTHHAAAMTGIDVDALARSCAINYNGQGELVMKVYSAAGADTIWQNADDTLLLDLAWKQPGTTGDASLTVKAPGIPGYADVTIAHYYRSAGAGAERDLVRDNLYIGYNVDGADRVTRRSRYSFVGNAAAWPGPQMSDIRLDYVTYTYSTGELLKCTKNDADVAQSLVRDVFQSGLLSQRQFFTAGADGIACNNDDALSKADGYVLEKI